MDLRLARPVARVGMSSEALSVATLRRIGRSSGSQPRIVAQPAIAKPALDKALLFRNSRRVRFMR
jgi:hypothetical protein